MLRLSSAALRSGSFLGLFLVRLNRTRILALCLGIAIDQLDHRHRRSIAMTEARLVDAAVTAGALAVLHSNSIVDDATVRLSLPEAGLSPAHLKCMWSRLLNDLEDPRLRRKAA